MRKIGFLMLAVIIALAVGCGQKSSSNSNDNGNNGSRSQGGPGGRNFNPEEFAKRQSEEMKKALDLSDEQTKQVYDISIESSKKMREMREKMQDGGDREAMREMFQQARQETDEKIKALLTDGQKTKYDEWQEERRERMRQQRGNWGGGSGGGN